MGKWAESEGVKVRRGRCARRHVSRRQPCMRDMERAIGNKHGDDEYHAKLNVGEKPCHASVTDGISKPLMSARSLLKSESISASKCIGEKPKQDRDEDSLTESMDETADEVSEKVAQLKT
uniref:Uncharacterized protein n=1 Tax=Oryza glumipatula TaxID=40148 RepID=A0A0E0A360_9ORYZ